MIAQVIMFFNGIAYFKALLLFKQEFPGDQWHHAPLVHKFQIWSHRCKHNKTLIDFGGVRCVLWNMINHFVKTFHNDIFSQNNLENSYLTHWGRVTHMCIGNLTNIGSDNGLSPRRYQAIIWTIAGILLIGPIELNFNAILIIIRTFSFKKMHLTHWGRVTYICVRKLTIIGSDNGLLPGRRQAIIWNNAGLLLIEPLGTNFSEISIGIQTFSFKTIHLNMSSAKWCPFCLGLNVLIMLSIKWQPFCLGLNVLTGVFLHAIYHSLQLLWITVDSLWHWNEPWQALDWCQWYFLRKMYVMGIDSIFPKFEKHLISNKI